MRRYQIFARLYAPEDIVFVREFLLAHGGDPRPTLRALRRDRWHIGMQYLGDLVRDVHYHHRRCGDELARAGLWGPYYRRWFLLVHAYTCLARLVWVGLRFRFGLGETDHQAVIAIVARALELPRAMPQ